MRRVLAAAMFALGFLVLGLSARAAEPHAGAHPAAKKPAAEAAPAAVHAAHPAGPHWDYDGAEGPANWGGLKPEYAVCALGQEQSPIDLAGATPAVIDAPAIHWGAAQPSAVVNNGHTIQADFSEAGFIEIGRTRFDLLQVHFHAASEHTLEGRHYPLEAHFVHRAPDGALGVVGVFFEEGAANPALEALFKAAPAAPGKASLKAPIDLRDLLPGDRAAYRYQGSLTTPPCAEVVTWTVFSTPIQASRDQIAAFTRLYSGNFRPVQPLNRRFLLRSN